MKTIAIIVAAGKGLRMGGRVGKQFLPLKGRSILARTLVAFDQTALVDQILVVLPTRKIRSFQTDILAKLTLSCKIELVTGGAHRQQSVYNGLEKIDDRESIVLIHDGVRPFIQPQQIADAVSAARKTGACLLAVPVTDTLKETRPDNRIRWTLDRQRVWAAQTPQAFRFPVIWQAHQAARQSGYAGTDDAQLVERLGRPVMVIPGSRFNIKITTPEDLILAEAFLATGQF
ncbi:MAG: 2-C-methyl-D-erythritol 4-phosphate cytidylyltransferase [Deltaproteobacteria bacterium]|nr:MAG: 2-C-methyl-D-erythritol 4-phosphate cytidylyltransferase [Deltaproteobacteria bacterium]